MNNQIKTIVISAIIGALIGTGSYYLLDTRADESNELIADFYATENAVHVSPHSLRKKMSKGDTSYVLVDLRSPQEYEKEHIITAINIPAYKDPNTSAYEEKERITNSFKELIAQNPGKEVVVYCYSIPCMTGRKVGQMLVEHEIFVKHLGIGWNEWRYYWDLWNHDGETPSKMEDYIYSGKEAGVPKIQQLPDACGEGELSC